MGLLGGQVRLARVGRSLNATVPSLINEGQSGTGSGQLTWYIWRSKASPQVSPRSSTLPRVLGATTGTLQLGEVGDRIVCCGC